MKWPSLVPMKLCRTPVKIYLTDGITEDGESKKTTIFDGMCNCSEKTHSVMTAEKQLIALSSTALISGDINAGESITGEAEIEGKTHLIYSASRARNPDGSVNFVKLELV